METVLGLLMIIALANIFIGLLSAIVKKIKKKSAKKSLLLVAFSVVIFIVAVGAFPTSSDNQENEGDNGTVVSDNKSGNIMDEKNDKLVNTQTEPETDMNHNEDKEYIGDDLRLEYLTDFSEGRAFVQFIDRSEISEDEIEDAVNAVINDDDKVDYVTSNWNELNHFQGYNRAALINTQGQIVWKSEYTKNDIVLSKKSEFADGAAYCIFEGNDNSRYYIIDSDGNCTFTKDVGEDYVILGHGGGEFLVAEHISDFDTNQWQIGTIDKNGTIVSSFQVYEQTPPTAPAKVNPPSGDMPDPNYDYWEYLEWMEQNEAYEEYMNYSYIPETLSFDSTWGFSEYTCEYRGEHVFELNRQGEWGVLINTATQNVIYTWRNDNNHYIQSFLSVFEDGAANVLCRISDADGTTRQSICSLNTDGTVTEIASADWMNYGSHGVFSDGMMFLSDRYGWEADGEILLSEGAYYNIAGKKVLDFPEYQGKNLYYGDAFHNGYAILFLQGADGRLYITAINKSGEKAFELMEIAESDMAYMSEDGKYLTVVAGGHLTVFDINGKALVSVECDAIDQTQKYSVYNGVIKIADFYVNVEEGTIIGLHDSVIDRDFSITLH